MAVGLSPAAIHRQIQQFQDMVVNTLGDRHSTEILDAQGKARLKEELMDMINNVLKHGAVRSLYFSDFAVQ